MKKNLINRLKIILLISLVFGFTGCTTLDGPPNPDDPFESFNRSVYTFNENFDEYLFKPVAKGYRVVTPSFIDKGITNFFSNIDDIVVVINDVLQFKLIQTASDISRFVINSTIGVFGLFDVASHLDLIKHNEDFGQTLGTWGIGSGPYLVLPFIGPSNLRDAAGFAVDSTQFDIILTRLDEKERIAALAIKYIDMRADLLSATNLLQEIAPDPYAFIRDAWVQRRLNLLYDGNPPITEEDEDLFEDDLFTDDIIRK